jgi:hypothetical protein
MNNTVIVLKPHRAQVWGPINARDSVCGNLIFVASTAAMASPVRCYLEVGGRVYLDGICNYESLGGGSFSIGTGDPPSKYFAYVEINVGVARGY